jgi:hypothetical protein
VKRVDVENSLAGYDGAFKAEMGEAGIPWAGEVAGWACERGVDKLI